MLNWISYALMAMTFNATSVLAFKYLSGISNAIFNNALNFLMYSGVFAFLVLLIKKDCHIINPLSDVKIVALIFVVALFQFLTNYYKYISLTLAPNPGYAMTTIAFSAVIVTILSIVCFNSHINLYTLAGIVMSLTGLILIITNSGK